MKKILLTYMFMIMSAMTCYADGVNTAKNIADTLSIENYASKYFRAFPDFPVEQLGENIQTMIVAVPAIIYSYEAETTAIDIQINENSMVSASDIYWTIDKKKKTLKIKSHKGMSWMQSHIKTGDIVIRVYGPKNGVKINIDPIYPVEDGGLCAIKSEMN